MALPATFRKWQVHTLSNKFDVATRLVTMNTSEVLAALKDNEVAVRNEYVAINASDTNFTAGRYDPRMKPPFDCGFESLGVVVAAGKAVKNVKVGQAVTSMAYGAFTELQILDSRTVIAVPSTRPEILALLVSGLTASLSLRFHGHMTSGETVLVTAAAGGAGQIAVQLAKMAGNHVIGTCSSDDKVAMLKSLGCDRVINYKKESIRDVLKSEYKRGVNIVFESVGGQTLRDCFDNLATKGRLIIIGAMSNYGKDAGDGPMNSFKGVWPDNISTYELLQKSTTVTGFFLNHYMKDFPSHLAEMTASVTAGKLRPTLDMPFVGIESVPKAIAYLQEGRNTGKVIVPLHVPKSGKL